MYLVTLKGQNVQTWFGQYRDAEAYAKKHAGAAGFTIRAVFP